MSSTQKVWFITGASRGFGRLMVEKLLSQGQKVVATARKPEAITDSLQHSSEQLLVLPLDVTDENQAHAAAKAAIEKFGQIDVLVNNAGYGILGGVEETSAAEVEKNFATNVFGLLNVTRAVLPYMRAQRSGHILNLSSIGGQFGFIGWGVYGSTKFAVEGLSESLAQEVAPLGIHVTIVEPGFFRTDFLAGESLARVENVIADYEETVGSMRSQMSAANKQQPGDPKKAAQAMIDIAFVENPPLRLMLGADTLEMVATKIKHLQADMEAWKHVSVSTGFDE
ncbi:SDR family NAD(P)-dependent oxidoreductase [Brevibacillus nitrificans]|uniref:SDR family NAD(P)-dependent oxidoreductase n=1 Tax=Brevibacillus nitrificans TaxID=651560 RepID=A0A3M8DM42_9BACL|nr:oxidoreductase [Brevibacillus nitrificans]RNB88561.1 SDR family NAD(P)-dependent oxidoreductase [Brevibacillus nitrificans]